MGLFFLGLAAGILATCTGSALVVWQLIRRAPRIAAAYDRGVAAEPNEEHDDG